MRLGAFLAALALAGPAAAETVVSPAPEAVSVTLYRAPGRSAGGSIDLDDLTGFAVVSEKRTVVLPPGETILRFEGVANGMLATSAVIEGLPGGVREKNRNAKLLTPRSLVEASVGGEATLVRTNPATGREQAIPVRVLSGGGGVLLQSAQGIEALHCSALPERLVFNALPDGLSDKPTLSVRTQSDRPVTATVTLSYLSQGFDWTTNYVAHLNPDGKTLSLTGWVTLANGNSISFPNAPTQIVAGTVNHEDDGAAAEDFADPGSDTAQCWPWDTTATHDEWFAPANYYPSAPPPPPAPMAMMARELGNLPGLVGAKLQQEELGDLKLYRTPQPTTIAANGQKQVLLLSEGDLPFRQVYRVDVGGGAQDATPTQIVLQVKNDRGGPLGQPLPAGQVAVFEDALGRPMLLGEDQVRDATVGETLEIKLGASPDVQAAVEYQLQGRRTVRLYNARAHAVTVEVRLDPSLLAKRFQAPATRGGYAVWSVVVPAQGEARLSLRLKDTA